MTKFFQGTYTALITPFANGVIDYKALEKLLAEQVAAKIDGLVILGTTGENPTINDQERRELVSFVVKQVKGKTKIIIGTGNYATDKTIEQSQEAEKLGADAILVINPYYNKPTQEGLYQHFMATADSVKIPMMLYNIKGRTAVNLETKTLLRLVKHPNIIAVKESSGDLQQIMDVIAQVPEDFAVLSGDDFITYPMITLGAVGVVSVLSNVLPKEVKTMVDLALAKNYAAALKLHYQLLPLIKAIFIESNPLPIKTLLAAQGKIKAEFRLPLCAMQEENKEKLLKIFSLK
jgi:4-hydroxy-tetrahydrodipicolinate synthase